VGRCGFVLAVSSLALSPGLLLATGGCAAPQVSFVRSACDCVMRDDEFQAVSFTASIETRGLTGRQVVYRVGLMNRRLDPIVSTDGRYQDATGRVAATKTLMVHASPWVFENVSVSIPAEELEVNARDLPVVAEFGVYRPDGICLAREDVIVPLYRAPKVAGAGRHAAGVPLAGRRAASRRPPATREKPLIGRPSRARPRTPPSTATGRTTGGGRSAAGDNGATTATDLITLLFEALTRHVPTTTRPARPVQADPTGPPAQQLEAREPPRPGPATYRIRSGDTLSSIAAAFYGDAGLAAAILWANPGLEARRIPIGRVIVLPSRETVQIWRRINRPASRRAVSPRSRPGGLGFTRHVIREGDTLGAIALKLLSDAARWTEIRARELQEARTTPDAETPSAEK
jgi:nucleoid-associated protein YgaU